MVEAEAHKESHKTHSAIQDNVPLDVRSTEVSFTVHTLTEDLKNLTIAGRDAEILDRKLQGSLSSVVQHIPVSWTMLEMLLVFAPHWRDTLIVSLTLSL